MSGPINSNSRAIHLLHGQNAHDYKKQPKKLGEIVGLKLVRDHLESGPQKYISARTENRLGLVSGNETALKSMADAIGKWVFITKFELNGDLKVGKDNQRRLFDFGTKAFKGLKSVVNEANSLTQHDKVFLNGKIEERHKAYNKALKNKALKIKSQHHLLTKN